jgi:hypothetical protein
MRIMQALYSADWAARQKSLEGMAAMGSVGMELIDDGGTLLKSNRDVKVGYSTGGGQRQLFLKTTIPAGEGIVLVAKDATTMVAGLRKLAELVPSGTVETEAGGQIAIFGGRFNDGDRPGYLRGVFSMVGQNIKTGAKMGGHIVTSGSKSLLSKLLFGEGGSSGGGTTRDWREAFTHWEDVVRECGREGRLMHKCAVVFITAKVDMPAVMEKRGKVSPEQSSKLGIGVIASVANQVFYGK